MRDEIFDLIIQLEESFADFYKKLKTNEHLKDFHDTLKLMEDHCHLHSNEMKEFAEKIIKPTFNKPAVVELDNRMKDSLFKEILHNNDNLRSLQDMANAEETLGELYLSISQYLKKLQEYYGEMIKGLEKISNDEFIHRDYILRQIKIHE